MFLEKEIIVLGDVEMGCGNLTDDFISDRALSELIKELSKRRHPVDLIFNGDTFDFLKCPYFKKNQLVYPRHVTEKISLAKLNLIQHAHSKVFHALRKFIKVKKHRLYFIFGNHDFDLVYPQVQKKIKSILENSKQIHFLEKYRYKTVYVEHGQQYDFLNKISFDRLFLTYQDERILNLPFTSLGLISKFMEMKEDHPFLERIFPRQTLFNLHRPVVKKITLRTTKFFLKSVLYYPFRYYFDPTYTLQRELFREFYKRLKKVHWDVDNIVKTFKRKRKRVFKKDHIHILGHIHEKYIEDKDNKVLIHPGSWRDEYNLNPKTRKLTSRLKRYVQVIIADGNIEYQVIDHPIKRSTFDFDKVIEDEMKFIKSAAREEKFESVFY